MAESGKGGKDRAGGPDKVGGARPVEPTRPATAVEETAPASAIERTGPVTAPHPLAPLDAVVAALAAELRAGTMTVEQAVSRLVEDAIERQVAAALLDNPEAEAEVREQLMRHLAEDPYLIQKVRRLHQAK